MWPGSAPTSRRITQQLAAGRGRAPPGLGSARSAQRPSRSAAKQQGGRAGRAGEPLAAGAPRVTCLGPRPGVQQSDLRLPPVAARPAAHHLPQEQPHTPRGRAAGAAGRPEQQEPGLHGAGEESTGTVRGSGASGVPGGRRGAARRGGQEGAPRRVRRKLLPPARPARRTWAGGPGGGGSGREPTELPDCGERPRSRAGAPGPAGRLVLLRRSCEPRPRAPPLAPSPRPCTWSPRNPGSSFWGAQGAPKGFRRVGWRDSSDVLPSLRLFLS